MSKARTHGVFIPALALLLLAAPAHVNGTKAEEGRGDMGSDEGAPAAVDVARRALEADEPLKNPYTGDPEAIKIGQGLFRSTCAGCHGGNGGGGMGPPLTNEKWVYGSDDDTLFKLISLGSEELQKHGYSRKARESVVAPMPPVGQMVGFSEDDLWRILAFVRSKYKGRPEKRNW